MGRGKRRQGRGGGGGGRGGQPRSDSWKSFDTITKKHENLEKYYNSLLQLPEEEQAQFWEALRRELPNSFRFAGSKGHAVTVRDLLVNRYMPEIVKITHADGRTVEPPKAIPWYPNDLAWDMTTPKNIVRKFAPFSAFQKFLVSETSIGNISRQEVVSMIPPLVMDVRPGMTVLDMCASPGSKATQLLEMVHRGEEARIRKVLRSHAKEDGLDLGPEMQDELDVDLEADATDDGRATGLLIANDADYKRCHMLVHQLKRLSSPNMIVTNHDATMFPTINLAKDPSKPTQASVLKFDRILADVPCSGDGTMRKNVNLWKDWNPNSALGLHQTQIRILVRALSMLKPGGRMVYSTCSMNPVENEAVIGAAIERCGGPDKVDIVDCSEELSGLKRRPGLKDWTVIDRSGRIWNSLEEVQEHVKNSESGMMPGKIQETMFPVPKGTGSADLPLERCMRVYAHLQDTGGFFITVLHKKAEVKVRPDNIPASKFAAKNESAPAAEVKEESKDVEAEEPRSSEGKVAAEPETQTGETENNTSNGTKRPREEDAAATGAAEAGEEQEAKKPKLENEETPTETKPATSAAVVNKPQRNRHGQIEEPFKYLSSDHPVIQNIREFYSLSPRFPDDRFMIRNASGDPAKAIYYTSALAKEILIENEGGPIKFVHAGVKMFMKQEAPSPEVCRWRIQSEGIPIVQGYVGQDRVIHLHKKETFRKLLIEMFIKINEEAWRDLDEIGERVRDIGMGCIVLRVEPDGSEEGFQEHMTLPLWKSVHSLNLMLPKEDRAAMLLRIFNDTTPLVNQALTREKQAKVEAAEKEAKDRKAAAEEEAKEEGQQEAKPAVAEGQGEVTTAMDVDDGAADAEAAENAPSPASN